MKLRMTFLLCLLFAMTTLAAEVDKTTSQTKSKTTTAKKKDKKAAHKSKETAKQTSREERDGFNPIPARRLEKLQEAAVASADENAAGTAAEWAFEARAYPDTDISLDKIAGARAAAATLNGKFPTGKGRPGTWVAVGPSEAEYQLSPFRISYVPDKYDAGGRTTALVLDTTCNPGHCRIWAGAAGGGIWRADDALAGQLHWTFLSGSFAINAIGSMSMDPNNNNVLWVGTGEPNACGSGCEAGVGLYKTTDGGDTWSGPIGQAAFNARGVSSIAIDPTNSSVIYAASGRALRGASSVCCGGAVTLAPGAPPWGLYKSTDGGGTWTLIHNGAASAAGCTNPVLVANNLTACSPRGVAHVALDPLDHNTVYASSFARGVWRSNDGGATWTQIFAPIAAGPATSFTERPEFAVTALPNGKTRMYLGIGQVQLPASAFYRSDDVAAGSPTFTQLSSSNPADTGYGAFDYCTGQCWYDNAVYTPAGQPDMVYLLGSYTYGEANPLNGPSNARAVVLSFDAGVTWYDQTKDATDPIHPTGIHPDEHAIVTNPNNPVQFWESGDGGVIRSSGQLTDVSANCNSRGLSGAFLTRCQQLLSKVPTELDSMNKGYATLQFQSLSVSAFNANVLQGGTQDNGTWQTSGNPNKWLNTIHGDGGQSGFDIGDPNFRLHTFTGASAEVNFSGGALADWNWTADPISGGSQFYVPLTTDPAVSKTMYIGTTSVWRTKTWGMGTMSVGEFRQHCNRFTGDFAVQCGDWVPLGPTTLTTAALGSRSGGNVAAIRRAAGDSSTLWAATTAGRVFISKNGDAEPASSVSFTRIDSPSTPGRFISGISVDPANPNHAYISYSGYSASTPSTPGHVFEVTYDPNTFTATFVDRSFDLNDLPITDVAYDNVTGDLYASSDFGVHRLAAGTTSWTASAPGLPNAEVAGLTIVPSARKLYAAGHGLGAWLLNLP